MKQNLVRATLVFVALLISGSSLAQNYPKPTGHVNDFADIILPETRQQLESRLRDYRDKTSIEVAVVTVASLEGQTVEDYALKLFAAWGIGDKKKDNGILFLVAPNEGKVRIEVGYGMEPDLTDGRAGQILDQDVVPHFKGFRRLLGDDQKQKLTDGIVSGANAVITHLGNAPFENRLEERRLAAEKRVAEQKRRNEEFDAFMKTAAMVVGPLIIIGVLVGFWYWSRRREEELKSQHEQNKKNLDEMEKGLQQALVDRPTTQRQLEGLKNKNPRDVWADLEELFNKAPQEVLLLRQRLADLYEEYDISNYQGSEELATWVETLQVEVTQHSTLLGNIIARGLKVSEARMESPKLFHSIPQLISKAKKELNHKDVTVQSEAYLEQASSKYQLARSASLKPPVSWLKVLALLNEAVSLVDQAKRSAKNEINRAEEARRPRPVSRPSSRSSGGSSFGGFGGGGSGGGGASRSF